jgi:hypothetical protein
LICGRLLLLFLHFFDSLLAHLLQLFQIGIDNFNLCLLAQFRYRVLHLLSHQHRFNSGLDLIEGLRTALLAIFELDDMPAIVGLDWLGNFAGLQRKRRLGKLRHHFLRGEISQIAAIVL